MFTSGIIKGKKFAPRVPARRRRPGAAATDAATTSTSQADESTAKSSTEQSQDDVAPPNNTSTQAAQTEGKEQERSTSSIEKDTRQENGTTQASRVAAISTTRKEASADTAQIAGSNTSRDPNNTGQRQENASAAPIQQLSTPASTSTNVSEPPSGDDTAAQAASSSTNAKTQNQTTTPLAIPSTEQTEDTEIAGKGVRDGHATKTKRKRTTVKDTTVVAGPEEESALPSKKPRKVRKDKGTTRKPKDAAAVTTPLTDGEAGTTANKGKRKRATSSRGRSATQDVTEGEDAEVIEDDEENENGDGQNGAQSKRRRKRKERSPTPEDAEFIEVDIDTVTMDQLTGDRRQGQVSSREKAMRNIDWNEVNKKRRERLRNPPERASRRKDATSADADTQETTTNENGEEVIVIGPTRNTGPALRMVDGRLVIDETSTTIDRRANATADEDILETVEEDDLTMQLNSHSWIYDNRRDPADRRMTPNDRWKVEDDEKFYDALGMFGTDFGMIAKMFPGRTRRNIKHKFTREERANPELVKAALVGKVKSVMDMEKYLRESGRTQDDLVDPRKLDEELAAETAKMQPEIDAARKEHTETERQKKIAGAAGGPLQLKDVEGTDKKKQKKKKKNEPRGGENEEILGSIEDYDIPFPRR